jgi:hypothetical protein
MNTGSVLKIDSSNFSVVTYWTTLLTEWRHLTTCVRQSILTVVLSVIPLYEYVYPVHSQTLIVQDGPLASLFGVSWSHTYRHTLGLLWTSDQPVTETSTYTGQHNRHPRPERDSNPSNQATADLRLRAATGIGLCVLYLLKVQSTSHASISYCVLCVKTVILNWCATSWYQVCREFFIRNRIYILAHLLF